MKELAKRRKLPAILLTVVMLSALLAPAMTPPALAAAGEEVEWVEMTNPVSVNKLSGVWGSSGSDVYAVGTVKVEGKNQGIILRYDGSAWSQVSIPAVTKSFIGVWGSSANDVYAVGSGGVILHYNGSAWIQMIIPADVVLMGGVWGSSANDVYAVGHDGPTGSGVILHYNGSVWSKMTLPVTGSLIGVWGSSASDVYAVGTVPSGGVILHYDGADWEEVFVGTGLMYFNSIWGSSAGDVFAAGYNMLSGGVLFHYDDSEWNQMTIPADTEIQSIWGTSGSDVYAVGVGPSWGAILHYDGSAWSEMTIPAGIETLGDVWGSSANDIFAVEIAVGGGAILHYYKAPPDETPPAFSEGYPRAEKIIASGFDLKVKLDEPGTVYYKAVADGEDPGSDYAGWTAVDIPDSGEVSAAIGGLASDTAYDLYVIAKDEAGNMQVSPVKLDVSTAAEPDTAPPAFSEGYPRVEKIIASGFDLKVKLDEPGIAYYKVVASGAEPGTAYETWTAVTVPASDEVSTAVSGLTPGTAHDLYVIAKDEAGNLQAAPVKLAIDPAPQLSAGEAERSALDAGIVEFTSDRAGSYYYAVVEADSPAPNVDTSGAGTSCGTEKTVISLSGLNGAGAKDVYIAVKAGAAVSSTLKITLPAYEEPADKTQLDALIAEAEQLKSGDYTEESWAGFTEALQTARTVSAKEDATQTEVDNATAALSAAKEQLVMLGGEVKRTAGGNRYDTSAKTALDAYPNGAETVIIARGDDQGNFADGLAASYLAGVKDAPVLLTSPGSLPQEIEAAINKLGATKAYVLGGELAVSQGVESKLKSLGLEVERITGNNRYATAAAIAAKGGPADTAIVVSGFAPADSLVAGSLAFSQGYPLLLVDKNSVPAETKNAITSLGIKKIIVIGGENAVSKAVYNELGAKERYAGQSRIETSLDVAEKAFKDAKDFSIVGYLKLADAVGAAVNGNPIIYVKDNISDVDDYLTGAVAANSNFTIFGGTLAVSNTVEDELKELLK